jgi:hypothetical protein
MRALTSVYPPPWILIWRTQRSRQEARYPSRGAGAIPRGTMKGNVYFLRSHLLDPPLLGLPLPSLIFPIFGASRLLLAMALMCFLAQGRAWVCHLFSSYHQLLPRRPRQPTPQVDFPCLFLPTHQPIPYCWTAGFWQTGRTPSNVEPCTLPQSH